VTGQAHQWIVERGTADGDRRPGSGGRSTTAGWLAGTSSVWRSSVGSQRKIFKDVRQPTPDRPGLLQLERRSRYDGQLLGLVGPVLQLRLSALHHRLAAGHL